MTVTSEVTVTFGTAYSYRSAVTTSIRAALAGRNDSRQHAEKEAGGDGQDHALNRENVIGREPQQGEGAHRHAAYVQPGQQPKRRANRR